MLDLITISYPLTFIILTHHVQLMASLRQESEVCNMETFNVTCETGHVILIHEASYGRMKVGRCVRKNLGYLGCKADVLPFMDSQCSGRQQCQVPVPNHVLYSTKPCIADTTPYLQVFYSCIPVSTGSLDTCIKERVLLETKEEGHLSSETTKPQGLGTSRCPWLIRMLNGRRIQLTMYNLLANDDVTDEASSVVKHPDICYEFAVVREKGEDKSLTACGNQDRKQIVYVSRGNEILLQFTNPTALKKLGAFLLKYEATGCPRLRAPPGGWVTEESDNAVIRCNSTQEVWYLTCKGNTWTGQYGNCTGGSGQWNINALLGSSSGFPYGVLMVVAIGVALGVFIGGFLLTMVVVYMRRRQHVLRSGNTTHDVIPGDSSISPKYNDQGDTWPDRPIKYPRDDQYLRESSFSTIDRESGYKTASSMDEGALYFDQDVGRHHGNYKQHIYESPSFS